MSIQSSYKTIEEPVETILFKEKGSKFIGYLYPVKNEKDVKEHLEGVKKKYHDARHWCYAYRLGFKGDVYRVNDDGEPGNTAGQPIYGRLLANDVTDVLLIVVRYFGGVKLGVGGLIKAYKACAHDTLLEANIIEKEIKETFKVKCTYNSINQVMRIIKTHQIEVVEQIMHLDCVLILSTSVAFIEKAVESFKNLKEIEVVYEEEND